MKPIKILLSVLIVFATLASAVSAARYIEYNFWAGTISNGALTTSNTSVTDVNAIGFVCADANCQDIRYSLWRDPISSGADSSMVLTYPTRLAGRNGYGIYYYTPGYITWESHADWRGTKRGEKANPTGPINLYLSKIEACRAQVDTFSITNEVQPNIPLLIDINATLDAMTYAAIHHAGPLEYVPPALLNDYYSVATKVTLTVVDQNGNNVSGFPITQDILIPFSGSQRVQFVWTPETAGTYTAIVSTDVTDAKCSSYSRQSATSDFRVLPEFPRNSCYTIINGLAADDISISEGESINVYGTRISNYINNNYDFTPIPTNLVLSVDGNTVQTQNPWPANSNTLDPAPFSFNINGLQQGQHTVCVSGTGSSSLCGGLDNIQERECINVYVNAANSNAPSLENLPDLTTQENTPFTPAVNQIDLWQYANDSETLDENLVFRIVSQTNPTLVNCTINGNRYISCGTPALNQYGSSDVRVEVSDGNYIDTDAFTVTVTPVQNPNQLTAEANGPYVCTVGQTIALSGAAAGGAVPYTYTWDLNNDRVYETAAQNPSFTCSAVGNYVVVLRVADSSSNIDTDAALVSVTNGMPGPGNEERINAEGIIVRINSNDYIRPGETLGLSIRIESNIAHDLEDMRVRAVVQELGVSGSSRYFDINSKDEENIYLELEIPKTAEPGMYDIRLTVSNDEIKRILHRDFRVVQ